MLPFSPSVQSLSRVRLFVTPRTAAMKLKDAAVMGSQRSRLSGKNSNTVRSEGYACLSGLAGSLSHGAAGVGQPS